jgi:hypothetical protein
LVTAHSSVVDERAGSKNQIQELCVTQLTHHTHGDTDF